MRGHRRIAAVAALTALMVSGCSPSYSPADQPPAGPSGQIDMNSFRGESLDYVYFTDGPDEAPTRELIGKFEQETGAKVNLQIVPFADLERTLQSRINSGAPPHVARTNSWTPFRDALVDLKTYFGDSYPDQFLAGPARTATAPDGQMLGVPSDITMNGPLVNVDAFAKAGVPLPTPEKPWTWDEMITAAVAVQKANGMESAIAIDKSGHRLSTVLSEFGTAMIGPDGKEGLDPAKATTALGKLNQLAGSGALLKDLWLESGSRYKGANEQFLAQQVPVYLSGNWQVSQFAKTATFKWAAAPNPCAERCGGFPGGKYMVAFSDSENPELGAAFVEWMNRADAQRLMAEKAFWIPTRKDLVSGGITYPDRAEDMKTFLADVAKTPEETYLTNSSPAFTPSARLLVEQVGRMFAGQQDPAATTAAVKTGVADAVAKSS